MIKEGQSYKEKISNATGIAIGLKALEKFGENKVIIDSIIQHRDKETGESITFINEHGNEPIPGSEMNAIAEEVQQMKVSELAQYIFDNVKEQEQLTKAIRAANSINGGYNIGLIRSRYFAQSEEKWEEFGKIKLDQFQEEYSSLIRIDQTRGQFFEELKQADIKERKFLEEVIFPVRNARNDQLDKEAFRAAMQDFGSFTIPKGSQVETVEQKSSLNHKSLQEEILNNLKQIQEKLTEIGQNFGGRGA